MNKREVVWLIIRLIGVYLLYTAFIGSVQGLGNFLTALQAPDLVGKSLGLFLPSFFIFALEGILGLYLCLDGKVLFNILNREGAGESS